MKNIKGFDEVVNEAFCQQIELTIGVPIYVWRKNTINHKPDYCGVFYYAGNGCYSQEMGLEHDVVVRKADYIVPFKGRDDEDIETRYFSTNEILKMNVNLDEFEVGKSLILKDIMPDPKTRSEKAMKWYKEMVKKSSELTDKFRGTEAD